MRFTVTPRFIVIALIAGAAALALSLSMGVVTASSAQNGQLHLVKECTQYSGQPGGFCTFTDSNLAQIPVVPPGAARVIYSQAPIPPAVPANGFPFGYVDSNVVLFVGTDNWAVGRCTLDPATWLGVCTFSDGTGDFVGFEARVDVDCTPSGSPCTWDGTYRFRSQPKR
jgi:hypothetical protein